MTARARESRRRRKLATGVVRAKIAVFQVPSGRTMRLTRDAGRGFAFALRSHGREAGQAAACGASALNGKAGGKAQSGNMSMICLALAFMLSTPERKLMTKTR